MISLFRVPSEKMPKKMVANIRGCIRSSRLELKAFSPKQVRPNLDKLMVILEKAAALSIRQLTSTLETTKLKDLVCQANDIAQRLHLLGCRGDLAANRSLSRVKRFLNLAVCITTALDHIVKELEQDLCDDAGSECSDSDDSDSDDDDEDRVAEEDNNTPAPCSQTTAAYWKPSLNVPFFLKAATLVYTGPSAQNTQAMAKAIASTSAAKQNNNIEVKKTDASTSSEQIFDDTCQDLKENLPSTKLCMSNLCKKIAMPKPAVLNDVVDVGLVTCKKLELGRKKSCLSAEASLKATRNSSNNFKTPKSIPIRKTAMKTVLSRKVSQEHIRSLQDAVAAKNKVKAVENAKETVTTRDDSKALVDTLVDLFEVPFISPTPVVPIHKLSNSCSKLSRADGVTIDAVVAEPPMPQKILKDGNVKFTLRPSPLTPILEQRLKKGAVANLPKKNVGKELTDGKVKFYMRPSALAPVMVQLETVAKNIISVLKLSPAGSPCTKQNTAPRNKRTLLTAVRKVTCKNVERSPRMENVITSMPDTFVTLDVDEYSLMLGCEVTVIDDETERGCITLGKRSSTVACLPIPVAR